nr:coiled-coil domain-containing protein 116 [Anolis sagrei ordinatus]
MSSRRYSGYLADDESMWGPQMRNPSPKRKVSEWRNALRQPSPHPFWNPEMTSSRSTTPSFCSEHHRRHKSRPSTSSAGESRILADEFSEFVDFLADENVLDSLQRIMEDAVRKLREVTLEDGQRLFNVQEDSHSSAESEAWSFSYSSTRSHSRYPTSSTATDSTSSSEEDWFAAAAAKQPRAPKAEDKVCLLDKYASRLPKLDSKKVDHVSGRFHAETFSERSGDDYFYRQEHLHIWAKLAESFEKFQPPKKDYFSKFKKEPQESASVESLQKEITNVLKRPMGSGIPRYSPDHQPFLALDFLEEHKILSALQDIINQAVQKVLQATGTDGVPLVNLFDDEGHPVTFWDSSIGGTEEDEEEEEERSGSGGSGSGEDTSDDFSDGSKSGDGKKKRKKKGKKKKKKKAETSPVEEKGKSKYAPPPLPKSRRKSIPEESQRKGKYVPPPLPKTKPRPPSGTPPPKPKYVPPPLSKPKLKKKESVQMETEPAKQVLSTKHIITPKDVKRARLQARPIPKQSVINFLIENAAKLVLYKYNYETLLCSKLGLISVPVTKVLLEIMFGYKRMKGSGIRLSSQIDWAKVYDEIYAPRPPKPKMPRHKLGDVKKGRAVKGKGKGKAAVKTPGAKKAVFFQPEMAGGKVVVMGTPTEQELSSWDIELEESATEEEYEDEGGPEIFEIVPPHFLGEGETDFSADEADEDSLNQPPFSVLRSSTPKDSPVRSAASEDGSFKISSAPEESEGSSFAVSPKKSGSRKFSVAPGSTRGSQALFPEVEPAGPSSAERVRRMSSRRSTLGGEGSKTVFPKI